MANQTPSPELAGDNAGLARAEQAVMVCPQCEGEGGYADGLDESACTTECTRCGSNGWIVDLAALRPTQADNVLRQLRNALTIAIAEPDIEIVRGQLEQNRDAIDAALGTTEPNPDAVQVGESAADFEDRLCYGFDAPTPEQSQ